MRGLIPALTAVMLCLSTAIVAPVHALEPVTAPDDPFALPGSGPDAVFVWPGSELFGAGGFGALAWQVPFGMDEFAVSSALAGYRHGRVAMSGMFSSTGFDLYGEDNEKAGLAFMPVDNLSIGVRLTRHSMRISGFGQASAWSADAGAVFMPNASVTLAVATEDLAGAELGASREPVDGRTRFLAAWDTGDMRLFGELSQVRRFDTAVDVGFVARLYDCLMIGAAGGTEPDRVMALCGVSVRKMMFCYRGNWHPELGMTHGFTITAGTVRNMLCE